MSLTEECQAFKHRHDLLEVADRLGIPLKREGDFFRMAGDRSVVIYRNNFEWRWQDKARPELHGDVIDFIKWHQELPDTISALMHGRTLFGEESPSYQNRENKPIAPAIPRTEWCKAIADSRSLPSPELLELFPLLQVPRFKGNPDSNYWGIGSASSGAVQYRRIDGELMRGGNKAQRIRGVQNRPIGLDQLKDDTEAIHLVEGEGDAVAVWTLLQDRWKKDLSRQVLVVFCGADIRLREREAGMLAGRLIKIWAQNDPPGLELAKDSFEKLMKAGCDVRVMVPSTEGADWGDYYIKNKFLPLSYNRSWLYSDGWNNLLGQAKRAKEKQLAERSADRKIHQINGAMGGRPNHPSKRLVDSLLANNSSLGTAELCRQAGLEPNRSNKRNVQRWIKAFRKTHTGATKPPVYLIGATKPPPDPHLPIYKTG